ncbi:MAG: NHL repeat-containing protein [Myxococcaceae bacterium]
MLPIKAEDGVKQSVGDVLTEQLAASVQSRGYDVMSPQALTAQLGFERQLDPGHSPAQIVFIADMTGANPRAWSPNTLSALSVPQGFDIDSNGHIFIADTGNHRIFEVDDFTPPMFVGTTEATFGTQGANTGQFQSPADIAISRDGATMLIADTANNRLVTLAHPASTTALNSTGWNTLRIGTDFTSAWNRPSGVAWGSDGKIYVTDTLNHRLVRTDDFTGAGLVTLGRDGSAAGQFVRPYGLLVR